MFLKIIFSVAFIFLASGCLGDRKFLKLPNLALIPDAVYDVYPGAPNKNAKFDTIQGAIEQALCDGYTPERNPLQFATIRLYPSETPYTGDGPDNEIHVPASIVLSGAPFSGSAIVKPQIKATVIFTNEGVQFGALINFISDFKIPQSSVHFLQPSPDKPAVKVINNPIFQFFFYVFTSYEMSNEFVGATAPIVEVSGGSNVGFFRGLLYSFAAEAPCVRSLNSTSVFIVWSNILAHKAILYEDAGAELGTLDLYFNDFFFGPPLVPFLDSEIRIIELRGKSIVLLSAFNNAIAGSDGIRTYTQGFVFLDATSVPAPGVPSINVMGNVFNVPSTTGGRQLIYDAPTCEIMSGNTVNSDEITATNVGILKTALYL